MRSLFSIRKVSHAAALVTVLGGLLSSNGEGIQLLPFPTPVEASASERSLAASINSGHDDKVTRSETRRSAFGSHKRGPNVSFESAGVIAGKLPIPKALTYDGADRNNSTDIFVVQPTYSSDLNTRPPPAL